MKATDMEGRNSDGTFAKGNKPKNGFDKRPEARHSGAWHKEDTPRYKMELIMGMNDEELDKARTDGSTAFVKAFANVLYLMREATTVAEAEACMRTLERMLDQVYGKMPQMQINVEADDDTKDEVDKIIRGFALP